MEKKTPKSKTPALKEYRHNPRKITSEQLEKLKRNIEELGDLSGIVHDLNTGELITGNQRSKAIDIRKCEIIFTEQYPEPTAQGTVALGYVIWEGQRLNYREVRWSKEQRKKANITANSLGGEWDWDILSAEFDATLLEAWQVPISDYLDSSEEDTSVPEEGDTDNKEPEERYTKKIDVPVYEPSEEKPEIGDLCDRTRYEELLSDIEAADDIPDEVREFLRYAAGRHIRFNYKLIADYYSHAPKNVQELMEDSALVIIDFRKAIELGYVKLSNEIREQYLKEYGDGDAE